MIIGGGVDENFVLDLNGWNDGNYAMDVVINNVANRINLIKK
jgi:hypothetical protein